MVEKEKKALLSKKAKMRSNAVKNSVKLDVAIEASAVDAPKSSKKEDSLPLPSLSFLTSTPKLECTFAEEKTPLVAPMTKTPPVLKPFWLQDVVRGKKDEDQGVRLLFNL